MKAKVLFFILISTLLVICVTGGFVYVSLNDTLDEKIQEISSKNVDIEIAHLEKEQLLKLSSRLKELEDLQLKINEILPTEKDQSIIVSQLVAIARENNIGIESIAFESNDNLPSSNSQLSPSTISSQISSIPVSVQSNPVTYSQIKGFLASIKKLQRHVSMKTLSISKSEGSRLVFSTDLEVHIDVTPPPAGKTKGKP